MDISARSDYAVRAMLTLAASGEGGTPVSVVRLAAEQELPRKFLEAILADLRRSGLVSSRMGANGGYLLARASADITVGDVIRAVDGPLVSIYGQRPEAVEYDAAAEALQQVWVAARYALRDVLEKVTIADLAAKTLPPEIADKAAIEDAWQPH